MPNCVVCIKFWILLFLDELIRILVPDFIAVVLDEAAVAPRVVERLPNRCVILQVVVAKYLLDRLSGLLRVVVRHLGEQMVRHMRVGDVMERRVQDGAERAVHRRQGSLQEAEAAAAVVRDVRGGVLQVGDQYQMVVDNQVRHAVVEGNVRKSEGVDAPGDPSDGGEEHDVGHHDVPPVSSGEELRRRVEMTLGRHIGVLPWAGDLRRVAQCERRSTTHQGLRGFLR